MRKSERQRRLVASSIVVGLEKSIAANRLLGFFFIINVYYGSKVILIFKLE